MGVEVPSCTPGEKGLKNNTLLDCLSACHYESVGSDLSLGHRRLLKQANPLGHLRANLAFTRGSVRKAAICLLRHFRSQQSTAQQR